MNVIRSMFEQLKRISQPSSSNAWGAFDAQLNHQALSINSVLNLELKPFLKQSSQILPMATEPKDYQPVLDQFDSLLSNTDDDVRHYLCLWLLNQYYQNVFKSPTLKKALWELIWPQMSSRYAPHLLVGLKRNLIDQTQDVLELIGQSQYDKTHRQQLVEEVFWLYLSKSSSFNLRKQLLEALKQLDKDNADVVNYALQVFPLDNANSNHAIIRLLGISQRFRIVKPLIVFAHEFPEYKRTIIRALGDLDFEEVDRFYLSELQKADHQADSLTLLELIRQIRKRHCRKATAYLMALFPYRDFEQSLLSQSINHEIALTMAEFGEKDWALQVLLPELMVQGMTRQYLTAIKILHLTEAVPLLKALLLMPESPDLSALQKEAFSICKGLMCKVS